MYEGEREREQRVGKMGMIFSEKKGQSVYTHTYA